MEAKAKTDALPFLSLSSGQAFYLLSVAIVILMATASAGGLLWRDLYQDNLLVASGWWGNDLVTLLLAVPVTLTSMAMARKGSLRGYLVWSGMVFYAFYNYSFYLFGAYFNAFFLIYVAIFTLSLFALVVGIAPLNPARVSSRLGRQAPVKAVGVFMLAVSLLLGIFHVQVALGYVFSGNIPDIVTAVGHPTNIIAALDLSLVVPIGILAGWWLMGRRPWGYLLAVLWNVKGAVYLTALSAASLASWWTGAAPGAAQVGLWGPIGLGSLVSALVLLGHLQEHNQE